VPPRKRRGPAANPGPQTATATNGTAILPDAGDRMARRRTRTRLADEHRRLGHARLADAAMPLDVYYASPWPRWAREWAA
jgi:hypothetical protein